MRQKHLLVRILMPILILSAVPAGLPSETQTREIPLERETGRRIRRIPASFLLRGRERALIEGLRQHPEWRIGAPLRKTAWSFSVGSTRGWYAYDFTTEKDYVVASTCRAVGVNCYVFVENAVWGTRVTQASVDSIRNVFDLRTPADPNRGIYRTDIDVFGSVPNVDGDPRVIILILDIRDDFTTTGGYVGGYFDSTNEYDISTSNRAEMIYLDADPVTLSSEDGIRESMSITAHEFQHMIHWQQDSEEISFVKEGCSLQAEIVCGYPMYDQNHYVNETNYTLLGWRYGEEGVHGDYSRAARFMAYVGEQAGTGVFRPMVASAKTGIAGINAGLTAVSLGRDFNALFRDWLVANVLNDRSFDPRYGYADPGLMKPVPIVYPFEAVADAQTVEPLAAVYLRFPMGPEFRIRFETGSPNLLIKAVETGEAGPRVIDITPGVEYGAPDLDPAAGERTFICMNTHQTQQAVVSYATNGSASGAAELKWDMTEPSGYLTLSIRDTVCVTFDAVPGAKLDSVRVALRRAGQITGGVWRHTGNTRPTPLGEPLAFPVTASIATETPVPYPVPFENWATIDLTAYDIDAGSPFAVAFICQGAGTVGQRVMVTEQKRTGSDHSLTWMNDPGGSSPPNWYSVGPQQDSVFVYLIRAYVSMTSGADGPAGLPAAFSLSPNYPNPFNPYTRFSFRLAVPSRVSAEVWNLMGHRVAALADRTFPAGEHALAWDGMGQNGLPAPSGVYLIRLQAGGNATVRKMVLER
ncbi:MAG: T9SS type A sorting domain-containing protein [bacterium]|nr:T9SS type A sorting domain-containing protein [bacterium]